MVEQEGYLGGLGTVCGSCGDAMCSRDAAWRAQRRQMWMNAESVPEICHAPAGTAAIPSILGVLLTALLERQSRSRFVICARPIA